MGYGAVLTRTMGAHAVKPKEQNGYGRAHARRNYVDDINNISMSTTNDSRS